MYRCISAYPFITVLFLLLPCIIILFPHLLSTNHKCTQPCYFPLLLKSAAQKERMDWNSSTRSSTLEESYFEGYFTTKTNFTPSLFKTSSLLLIMFTILLFLAPMLWKKVLPTFSKSSQNFWHLHVYIFVSKHLNKV
jgi:hypothetical protein